MTKSLALFAFAAIVAISSTANASAFYRPHTFLSPGFSTERFVGHQSSPLERVALNPQPLPPKIVSTGVQMR